MAGRKTKYTPERAAKVIQGLRSGLTKRAASSLGGVSEDTLLRWEKRYADFAVQCASAQDEAEARYTSVIAQTADGYEVVETRRVLKANGDIEETTISRREQDWRAALEWLKRRRRQDWGDLEKIALTDPTGQKEYVGTSDEERLARLVGIAQRLRAS